MARRRSAGGAMLLKTADDKSGDIDALEALLGRPDLDARQRRAIQDEIWSIRLGAKAETDAAYQLDFDLRDNKNWAVIHDLRIELEGQVAQIDHLVISRMLEVFVCESKSYTGGVEGQRARRVVDLPRSSADRHPLPRRAEPPAHRGPGAGHQARLCRAAAANRRDEADVQEHRPGVGGAGGSRDRSRSSRTSTRSSRSTSSGRT